MKGFEKTVIIDGDDLVFKFPKCGVYRVKDYKHPLGKGSYGQVFKAQSTQQGQKPYIAAIKRINRQNSTNTQRELEIFRTIKCELAPRNLIFAYDILEESSCIAVLMDLCEGDLKNYFKDITLSELESLEYLRQICYGLQILHDKSIIHRDIKLDNILFKTNFNDPNYPFPLKLYLSDYGLARELKDMQADMPTYKVGTIFTMAPEIYEPGDSAIYTREVDIYSLGCVLLKMVTGFYPGEKTGEVFPKEIDIKQYNPSFYGSAFMIYILEGCLQLVPANRLTLKQLGALLKTSTLHGKYDPIQFDPYLYQDTNAIINCTEFKRKGIIHLSTI